MANLHIFSEYSKNFSVYVFLRKTIEARGQTIKGLYHKTTTKVEKAKQELVERRKTAKFTPTEYDEILKKKRGDLFP